MHKDDLPVSEDGLRGALVKLCEQLSSTGLSNKPNSNKDKVFLEVFIVFDEAHPLTRPFNTTSTRNDFAKLQQALGISQNEPLFTFFLSMTGKISQSTPPHGHDPSNRINDGKLTIPTPFIWLGFDQLMGKHKIFGKNKTLKHVTSLDCIAHMGRLL
jgi:hypothetical protein